MTASSASTAALALHWTVAAPLVALQAIEREAVPGVLLPDAIDEATRLCAVDSFG
jgi:hypothetical protein